MQSVLAKQKRQQKCYDLFMPFLHVLQMSCSYSSAWSCLSYILHDDSHVHAMFCMCTHLAPPQRHALLCTYLITLYLVPCTFLECYNLVYIQPHIKIMMQWCRDAWGGLISGQADGHISIIILTASAQYVVAHLLLFILALLCPYTHAYAALYLTHHPDPQGRASSSKQGLRWL